MKISLPLITLIVLSSSAMLFAEDVFRFRGENSQGKYNEPGLLDSWPEEGLQAKWVISNLGEGYGSVAKVKDRLYLTCLDPDDSNKESVVCLDLNGEKQWQRTVGEVWKASYSVPKVTPTYLVGENPGDDRLFVLSGTGDLFCLAAADGEPIWNKNVAEIYETDFNESNSGGWGMAECVVVKDGKVFVTTSGKKAMAVALNVSDGSEIWKAEPLNDYCSFVSPILYENRLIVVTGRHLAMIDIEDGRVVWLTNFEQDTGGKNPRWIPSYCSPPIIKGNQFFFSGGYDQGGAMYEIHADGNGVDMLWTTKVLGSHHHGMVELDGRIYGSNWLSNTTGNWVCLDWDTGNTVYVEDWPNLGKGVTIFADGKFFYYEEKRGTLAVAKPGDRFDIDGSFRYDYGTKEHWPHPVISDGVLYVRRGISLAAFDIGKK